MRLNESFEDLPFKWGDSAQLVSHAHGFNEVHFRAGITDALARRGVSIGPTVSGPVKEDVGIAK